MKIRSLIIGLIISLSFLSAKAQNISARTIFLESPEYVFPAIGQSQKQELVRAFENKGEGTPERVKNIYGGESYVDNMTDSYISIKLDESSSLQIKLFLLVNNTPVICFVATSDLVPHQSVIQFCDIHWQPVDGKELFQLPNLEHFFKDKDDINDIDVKNALTELGKLTYEIVCDPQLPQLSVKITSFEDPIIHKQYLFIKEMLKADGVVFKWNKSKLEQL